MQHELRSGDQAEILTSKNQMPQPEWALLGLLGSLAERLHKEVAEHYFLSAELPAEFLAV